MVNKNSAVILCQVKESKLQNEMYFNMYLFELLEDIIQADTGVGLICHE